MRSEGHTPFKTTSLFLALFGNLNKKRTKKLQSVAQQEAVASQVSPACFCVMAQLSHATTCCTHTYTHTLL